MTQELEGLDPVSALRVRRVLRLTGLPVDEIDDAVQEVQLRVLERRPEVVRSLSAWACSVAANVALDIHRRNRRQTGVETRLRPHLYSVSDDSNDELRESVRAGLAKLTPELRAIVVLRFYADLTVPEIAAALAMPAGTVKSRLHRALSQLRAVLPKEVR